MPNAATRRQALESFSRMPGHLVRRVHQVATSHFAEECGGELTAVQYAALVAIGSHPGIDRSTIGDVLDRIEAKGWIARQPAPHDRRAKLLELSALGRSTLRAVEPAIGRVQERLLAPLTQREAETFVRLLIKVADGGHETPAGSDGA
jgi:DNA-binding MarR family transcriptional regulator